MAGTLIAPAAEYVPTITPTLRKTFTEPFAALLRKPGIAIILLFIVLFKLSDVAVVSLNGPFLLDIGFSLAKVGTVNKIIGFTATCLGAFWGAWWIPRIGWYRAFMAFGIAQVLANFTFLGLAFVGKHFTLMVIAVFLDNICHGLTTVVLLSFLLGLCDKQFSGTQYALLSALAGLGRVIITPIAGIIVEHTGWVSFYSWVIVIGLPSLVLLWSLRRRAAFTELTPPI